MNPSEVDGALLSQDEAHNDSLGSPLNNLSPFWIDVIAIALLLMVYFFVESSVITSTGILTACLLMVWCALRSNNYYHFIVDTPKSRIASASHGFVELHGICDLSGNRQTQGFLTGPPCVWHRYSVWSFRLVPFRTGASTLTFSITDDSGSCTVDPRGARILSSSTRTWIADGKRYSSRYIHPGATVYVLGQLCSQRSDAIHYHKGIETSKLLARWKKDWRWLVDEFDHNGDGEIDLGEWDAARARAETVSQNLHSERASSATDQVIGKPANGMPFIIADRDPSVLGNLFRILSGLNIAFAIFCFIWFCLSLSS